MLIDPGLLEHVAEQRALNTSLAELTAQIDAANPETPEGLAAQRAMMAPGGEFVGDLVEEAEERTVSGPAGEIAIRVLVPPRVDAVYLGIHGGGMIIGSAGSSDERNWELARYANVAVVSPEYRLAPEHQYPAGNEDCEAVELRRCDPERSAR